MSLVARQDWEEQAKRLKMLLAEAGYPNALVIIDNRLGPQVLVAAKIVSSKNVLVPVDVANRAFELSRVGLRMDNNHDEKDKAGRRNQCS